MKKLTVNRTVESKINRGRVLLEKEDFKNLDLQDQLVELYTGKGQFLATAYLSQQNKGLGWILSRQKIHFDVAYLVEVFQAARARRASFEADDQTTAYRLFNQDGDGLPGVTVDRYGDYAVFSWYNPFIYAHRDMIGQAFQTVYPEILAASQKIRFKGLDFESDWFYGEMKEQAFPVTENGVSYSVFLNDGLMTGIFLDQHDVRGALVEGLAAGQSLLNMFSYTAAFSVAAAMGGASETTSVDLAKRSRELSEAHFLENGLPLDNHKFVVMDVFDYFKYAKRHDLRFDVIVLDPPSFARNKKMTFSVAKDYHRLIDQSLDILNPGGMILASTNAANVSREKFKKEIQKGLGQVSYTIEREFSLPTDFVFNKQEESSNYLKVVCIRVNK